MTIGVRKQRPQRNDSTSRLVIYAALAGNLLVTATKFVAAVLSGSSAMLSEALHSLVDTSNELVLIYGLQRAKTRPDKDHPLGYGREIYFWSFIVAILIFTLGAGVSLYQGIAQVVHPKALARPGLSYLVLAASFVFEFGSWWLAFSTFRKTKRDKGYWEALERSKDPPGFMVLLEDSAALIGIAIAFAGVLSANRLHEPRLDGLASIAIACLLAAMAAILARESKSLLIGEPADRETVESILRIARSLPEVETAIGVLTVQLAPAEIVVALSLEFKPELHTREIESAIETLDSQVRTAHPEVVALFVRPTTPPRLEHTRTPYEPWRRRRRLR